MDRAVRWKTSFTALAGLFTVLVLTSPPARGQAQPPSAERDTAVAVRELSIGRVNGPEEYTFGRVSAVALGSDGSIFVADEQASMVRVYSRTGVHMRVLGGPGDGPGEFRAPASITIGELGLIYVRDTRRITLFAPSTFEVVDTWQGPPFPNSQLPSRLDREGRYFYPYANSLQRSGAPPEHFYFVYQDGVVVDTLRVPQYLNIRNTDPAWVRTSASGGRIFPGLNAVPFAALPSWDVTPSGTLVSGSGMEQRLVETGRLGDTIHVIETAIVRVRVPVAEREDSLRALRLRIDSLAVRLSRLQNVPDSVRAGQAPEYLPAYVAVHADQTGKLWIRRWPDYRSALHTVFDVYGGDGKYQCTVVLREALAADVAPAFAESYLLGVVQDRITEVDQVVLWRYSCAGGGAE